MATSVIGSGKEPIIILQPAEVTVVELERGGKMVLEEIRIPRSKHVGVRTHVISDIVASLAAVETADFFLWPYPYFMSVWTRTQI